MSLKSDTPIIYYCNYGTLLKNLTTEEIKADLLLDTGIMTNIVWLRAANPRERRYYRK
jgi:hypothetical protein